MKSCQHKEYRRTDKRTDGWVDGKETNGVCVGRMRYAGSLQGGIDHQEIIIGLRFETHV